MPDALRSPLVGKPPPRALPPGVERSFSQGVPRGKAGIQMIRCEPLEVGQEEAQGVQVTPGLPVFFALAATAARWLPITSPNGCAPPRHSATSSVWNATQAACEHSHHFRCCCASSSLRQSGHTFNKNCTGLVQAKFRPMQGILSQNAGRSRAIRANPVNITFVCPVQAWTRAGCLRPTAMSGGLRFGLALIWTQIWANSVEHATR